VTTTHRIAPPPGGRLVRRLPGVAGIGLAVLALVAGLSAPPARAANPPLRLTTPYPGVSVAPGSKVSFDLKVEVDQLRRVELSVDGVPQGWTAVLHGGGYVVDSVLVEPNSPPDLRLDVTVPASAAAQTYRMTVRATSGSLSDSISLDVTVNKAAAGQVTLSSDFPELQGASNTTFTFNVTLRNDTAQDLTFGLNAQGPEGWVVTARPSGSSQAASVQVQSGSSTTIQVTADPPSDVAAGSYPIKLTVTDSANGATYEDDLTVKITGQYSMSLTTPDGRLNANGQAGSGIQRTLVVQNTGTADLQNVSLTSSAPSGWQVTFSPDKIDRIPAGQSVNVTATITPSASAVAGDYIVTMRANTDQANASVDIRVTVETSLLYGFLGIALIVVVLGGLFWVFQRYGRR
jgi:uncharacterized repeat protein (TIGR01451 family)